MTANQLHTYPANSTTALQFQRLAVNPTNVSTLTGAEVVALTLANGTPVNSTLAQIAAYIIANYPGGGGGGPGGGTTVTLSGSSQYFFYGPTGVPPQTAAQTQYWALINPFGSGSTSGGISASPYTASDVFNSVSFPQGQVFSWAWNPAYVVSLAGAPVLAYAAFSFGEQQTLTAFNYNGNQNQASPGVIPAANPGPVLFGNIHSWITNFNATLGINPTMYDLIFDNWSYSVAAQGTGHTRTEMTIYNHPYPGTTDVKGLDVEIFRYTDSNWGNIRVGRRYNAFQQGGSYSLLDVNPISGTLVAGSAAPPVDILTGTIDFAELYHQVIWYGLQTGLEFCDGWYWGAESVMGSGSWTCNSISSTIVPGGAINVPTNTSVSVGSIVGGNYVTGAGTGAGGTIIYPNNYATYEFRPTQPCYSTYTYFAESVTPNLLIRTIGLPKTMDVINGSSGTGVTNVQFADQTKSLATLLTSYTINSAPATIIIDHSGVTARTTGVLTASISVGNTLGNYHGATLVQLYLSNQSASGITVVLDPNGANQALTLINSQNEPGGTGQTQLWGIVNPAVGWRPIVATWTGSSDVALGFVSFQGVVQTSVAAAFTIHTVASGTGTSTGTQTVAGGANPDRAFYSFSSHGGLGQSALGGNIAYTSAYADMLYFDNTFGVNMGFSGSSTWAMAACNVKFG